MLYNMPGSNLLLRLCLMIRDRIFEGSVFLRSSVIQLATRTRFGDAALWLIPQHTRHRCCTCVQMLSLCLHTSFSPTRSHCTAFEVVLLIL